MNRRIIFYDSTLRDGAQAEGISFSVRDKINIVKTLDELGIDYIEAGNPFSNPKDIEFFNEIQNLKLNSKIVAFGSTRRKDIRAEEDKNLMSLLSANVSTVAIFGKSWDLHVTEILKTTLDENLNMIFDTVRFLKDKGKEVVFDAEHFFDGYKRNSEYAIKTLLTAEKAGADCICLCDTNGGCFPMEIAEIVRAVKEKVKTTLAIHTHDDGGMAVANSVVAVENGVDAVQGTLLGYGERCGNANLSVILANLQLKRGYETGVSENIKNLTTACRKIAEISNVRLNKNMPYVGKSAFAHKAGMHIDGVRKSSNSFEHVSPDSVGNSRRFLMSEVAGRSTIIAKIQKFAPEVDKDSEIASRIVEKIKELEFKGYQFEGAEASFELLVLKQLEKYKPYFEIIKFKTIGEQSMRGDFSPASAMVKVAVNSQTEITADEGNGPVNALDKALRKALERFFPNLSEMKLTDYKVRILDSKENTSAVTRVLIESSDGEDIWTTIGVSKDIIEASLIACVDAIEYKLIKDSKKMEKQ